MVLKYVSQPSMMYLRAKMRQAGIWTEVRVLLCCERFVL